MGGVPQYKDVKLEFFFHSLMHRSTWKKPYEVLKVEYSRRCPDICTGKDAGAKGLLDPRWKIYVEAVPRPLKHLVHSKLIAEALPIMKSWLTRNSAVAERTGMLTLAFLFDELKQNLKVAEYSTLDPMRAR